MIQTSSLRRPGLWGLGAAAAGLTAGALMLERRHEAAIRADPEFPRLENPPRGRTLEVSSADGTRLHVERFGSGEGPMVLLVHGWTEALQYWTYVIEDLVAAGASAVAFDLRGHGSSRPASEGDYSLERFGEDVEAVLEAVLGPGQRATVVGHSLGAMSLVAWAQEHEVRRRACAAVLCNFGVDGLIAENLVLPVVFGRLKESLGRVFMAAPGSLPRRSTPLSYALARHMAFGPEGSPARVAFYERMLWECTPRARAAIGVALSHMDLGAALARLDVPATVIAGCEDRLTPPGHARRIAERLPDCRAVLELPATGHMAPLERPHDITRAIQEIMPGPADAD